MKRRLVVEADGGSRGNPGVAGYGALVRDGATGEVLSERAAPLGKESNNVAEYTGLVEGLRAVLDHAPSAAVTVRMDSKLVVEQMSGRWKIKHEDMKRLAAQARTISSEISSAGGTVTYEWIPRERNKAADKLSNDGMDGVTVRRDAWGPDVRASDDDAASGRTESGGGGSVPDASDTTHREAESVAAVTSRPDLGKPTRIILVRHGVTDFTGGKLDGRGGADPALNASGREQAERLARAVDALVVGAESVSVVTSSLTRAIDTGAPVATALGVEAQIDEDWDEQGFGEWDGLSFKEIHAQDAPGLSRLRRDATFCAPGGETRAAFDARIADALHRAVERGGAVVVVTHRIAIMSVLAGLLGLDMDAAWRLAAAPGSLTGVEVWRDGNAQVAFTNDTHHLR